MEFGPWSCIVLDRLNVALNTRPTRSLLTTPNMPFVFSNQPPVPAQGEYYLLVAALIPGVDQNITQLDRGLLQI